MDMHTTKFGNVLPVLLAWLAVMQIRQCSDLTQLRPSLNKLEWYEGSQPYSALQIIGVPQSRLRF